MEVEMIKFEATKNRNKNIARFWSINDKCRLCGKPISNPNNIHWIHEHDGGGVAVTEDEAKTMSASADLGAQPIGPDCWRKHKELHPYEWVPVKKTDKLLSGLDRYNQKAAVRDARDLTIGILYVIANRKSK
jgi:hypothetical protein